jgi:enoyl-CoA hydratase/carnithine racemase
MILLVKCFFIMLFANRIGVGGSSAILWAASIAVSINSDCLTTALTKSMMKKHFTHKTMETNDKEFHSFVDRLSSPETAEAVQAFMEKRKPDFSRFE